MRTLAGRVTLIVTLAVAAVLAVVGAVLIAEVGRRERTTFNRELRATAARAEAPARRALGANPQDRALQRVAGDFSIRLARRGRVVYDDLRASEVPIPARNGMSTVTSGTGARWRVLARTVRPRIEGRLVVSGSLAAVEQRIADARRTIALAFLLGLAVCAVAVRVLTALTLRPLGRLREGAAAVSGTRDLTTRVPASGAEEVDDVAGALNDMLARLEASAAATQQALDASRRFTADAGHELRTPLTSIRANLAALRHQRGHSRSISAEIERDLARLTALLDGLQALARGDAGAGRETAPVEVTELADAALADARRRHPGVDFAFGDAPDVTIEGDESGLRAALDNLLENAARHGARRVRLTVEPQRVLVDDDGPGIPEDERERVFERFARGRGATAPGSGLGLAIVAQQARLHGGRAAIEDSPLGGARLVLDLKGSDAP